MDYENTDLPKRWIDTSASAGPALLGAAAGLLISDLLHGNARRAIGLGLATLGVAAIAPKVTKNIKKKVTGPQTKRGSERTLDSIRNAGATPESFGFVDEASDDELHVV